MIKKEPKNYKSAYYRANEHRTRLKAALKYMRMRIDFMQNGICEYCSNTAIHPDYTNHHFEIACPVCTEQVWVSESSKTITKKIGLINEEINEKIAVILSERDCYKNKVDELLNAIKEIKKIVKVLK